MKSLTSFVGRVPWFVFSLLALSVGAGRTLSTSH